MMIEPVFSLEDACRREIQQISSRSQQRDLQQQQQQQQHDPGDLAKLLATAQKKEAPSRQSIQCRLARLYFEELAKSPQASSDSVLNKLEVEGNLLGKLVQQDELHTLIVNLYAGNKGYSLAAAATCPPPSLLAPALSPPSSPIDVLRYAKAYEQPRETKDCLPQLIEEYILETERGQGRIYHIKLSILQRPSNSEYLGELYVDIDYREAERKGSSCRFALGTRGQANHYIQQFTEIFTEEGRKNVKIQHIVPGQAPRVTCTPSMQRIQQQLQQQQQQQQQQLQQNPNVQRLAHQVKTQLVAQQLQQTQSQRVAQQILSARTLNSLSGNQLNSLAGQVANSIKAITEAAAARQQLPAVTPQQQQQQQPVASLINCLDNMTQGLTAGGVTSGLSAEQQQMARIPTAAGLAATTTQQSLDSSKVADLAAGCNGTAAANILVFQQQKSAAPTPVVSSNVPVLQAQLQAGALGNLSESGSHAAAAASDAKLNSTNLAISALATSLMNSAQQFTAQQQAAAAAAAAATASPAPLIGSAAAPHQQPKSNNAAILSLLNSAPANLQQKGAPSRRISLNAASLGAQRVLGQGNLITVPSSSGQVRVSFSSALTAASQQLAKQQPVKATATVRLARVQDPASSSLGSTMPGLSALLQAGNPNEESSVPPGITAASSLFERLTQPHAQQQGSQPGSPMTSPPPATPPLQPSQPVVSAGVNLQGVSLGALQAAGPINGLQNVQVSIPGLSQPITMSLNVSAATGPGGSAGNPAGVIVSLPISSATSTCSTVSSMVSGGAATIATTTTTTAGNAPTVVIANPANAHLSLPIAQLIPSAAAAGVKGLAQPAMRGINNAAAAGVALAAAQAGQAIQLVGPTQQQQRGSGGGPRVGQMQAAAAAAARGQGLPGQLVSTKSANQLVLSRNKQILTPIVVASKPMLMAGQAGAPSASPAGVGKQTLLAKTLSAAAAARQCSAQPTTLSAVAAGLSPQQLQQLQQHLVAQQQKAGASAANRAQPRGGAIGDDLL